MLLFVKIVAGFIAARLFSVEGDQHYHGYCPTDGSLKRTGTLTSDGTPKCPDHNVSTPNGFTAEALDNAFLHKAGEGDAYSYPGGNKLSKQPENQNAVATPPGNAAPFGGTFPSFGAFEAEVRRIAREETVAILAGEGSQDEIDARLNAVGDPNADRSDIPAVGATSGGSPDTPTPSGESDAIVKRAVAAVEGEGVDDEAANLGSAPQTAPSEADRAAEAEAKASQASTTKTTAKAGASK